MIRSLLVILLLVIVPVLQAHEFWMQPLKFQYRVGESVSLRFLVGENFVGEPWEIRRSRFIRFDHISGGQSKRLLVKVPESKGQSVEALIDTPGTHLFVMQSTNAFIELNAEDFNAYLKEDGLDAVYNHRKMEGTLNQPAKEYYARCVKLLVQAGDQGTDVYQQETGMPLEIIPLQNPYSLKQGEEMSFKVLYNGKPLPFALVKVWNRRNNNTVLQNIYTQKDGIITTRLGNTGMWMISCVNMVAASDPDVNWQSYWASFVFGL
jgi:uncharacterized GH25 family protein